MYVTAEEFLDMLHIIRERYRNSHLDLDDPEVMQALLLREFPEVEGVIPPPSYRTIRERYIPEEWRMLIPESRRGDATLTAGTPQDRFATTDPVATWCRQVVSDLDALRSDAITAMTYVVDRSAGMDSRTAMDRARATGHVFQLMIVSSRRGWIATHRAVSGTSGQPRDVRETRVVQHMERELLAREAVGRRPVSARRDPPLTLQPVSVAARPGYPARARGAPAVPRTSGPVRPAPPPTLTPRVRPHAPAATSASPARTRERLRRQAAQAGSPGSPRGR
jgi:hypothetical protein